MGIEYQKRIQPKEIYVTEKEIVTVDKEDDYRDLIERCGVMPSQQQLGIQKGDPRFTRVNGPSWAPDCRHISWSVDQFEIGGYWIEPNSEEARNFVPQDEKKPLAFEGLFLYSDKTQKTVKIYTAENKAEFPVFKKWKDRNTILFSIKDSVYAYTVDTEEIKPVK